MEGSAKEKQEALDKRYIRMASIWAENSYCKRRKVGALIVKEKMIISLEKRPRILLSDWLTMSAIRILNL